MWVVERSKTYCLLCISVKFLIDFNTNKWRWYCAGCDRWCFCKKWVFEILLYLIVELKLNSNDCVANTFSAVCLCLWIMFRVLSNLARALFIKLSPRFVGPYNVGAGVSDV